jgi:precorrin-4/cobalt-precorrin-4 C11-methyltransferase
VTEHARSQAELMPWPPATMAQLLDAYDRAAAQDLVVARLVGGDPAVYVKLEEELERVRQLGLPHEIVPGVGALSAAAAALGRQLVTAGSDDALVIASPKARVRELAGRGATMALYMAGERGDELQRELLAAGHPKDAECAVAHRLSWPDEAVFRCRLGELGERLESPALARQTLVIVAM